ncbi:hypothetical protein [Legionella fairfieldensis]|uniref:hypothetical protein n=1 Tax=Legionella fairfieldensis TaxID=45064 RepID=UPI00048CD352|nr:hypothetical protein [Legionella fairfieldensis]
MNLFKRNYLILLLLALVFATPGIMAYLCYLNPQWLGSNTTNKGKLLNPSVLFPSMEDKEHKWRLIFWSPNGCEVACLQQINKLARVRLALGRHLYEIEQWLVLEKGTSQMPIALMHSLGEQDIHVLRLTKNMQAKLPLLTAKPEVFIANPEGYLVLTYTESAQPEDIYHDIKQLLKKSG